jgi:hypothetical protein
LSEDLKVLIECDHRVSDESLSLDIRDFQTVRFPYPIANSDIKVRVNGYLVSGSSILNGPFSYARLDANGQAQVNIFVNEESIAPVTQKLVFNRPLKSDNLIEISYTSPLGYCRKCFGTGLSYDYQVLDDGTGFKKVTGLSKLQQDCLKAILTVRGSNIFHTWAGTSVESTIGEKFNPLVILDLKQEIGSVLSNLKRAQIEQSDYQEVTDDELLDTVDSISVALADYDPTLLLIEIDITSASGRTLAITQAFKSTGSIYGLLNA